MVGTWKNRDLFILETLLPLAIQVVVICVTNAGVLEGALLRFPGRSRPGPPGSPGCLLLGTTARATVYTTGRMTGQVRSGILLGQNLRP